MAQDPIVYLNEAVSSIVSKGSLPAAIVKVGPLEPGKPPSRSWSDCTVSSAATHLLGVAYSKWPAPHCSWGLKKDSDR